MKYRTGLWCLTVVVGAALVTGCDEEPPPKPVEFGSARPAGANLGIRPEAGSVVLLSQWPDACELVSDEEVRAILPQAKRIERKPVNVTILNMNPLVETRPGTTGEVPRGGCEFEFALPSKSGDTVTNSDFTVTVTALAEPALTTESHEDDKNSDATEKGFKDLAASWGAEDCYSVGEGLSSVVAHCRQGPFLFKVRGSSRAEGVSPGPAKGAKAAENIEAEKKRRQVWTDKVLPEVVRTVSARMA
ncbi:hypothetical protein SAVIM338S_00450 [Streptomyces avidinii]